jgi:S1-C subfamily serine protease
LPGLISKYTGFEDEEQAAMRLTERGRRAWVAAAMAAVIGGGGVAVGAVAVGPALTSTPAAAAPASTPAPGVTPAAAEGKDRSGYSGVVRRVLPSVVLIRTTTGLGSGVVLDDKGNIVTNAHVAGDAKEFQVQVAGQAKPQSAKLVGSYPPDDLAVIQAEDPASLTPARFGDSSKAQAGDVVLAIGNPLGLSGSVTEGIVSATGRAVTEPATPGSPAATLPDAIQTSAPINPGNSGGALVNTAGEVIGIPTLAAASPASGAQAQGIGFAIPSNLARDIAQQLIESGHVTNSHRAALGVQVATVNGADGAPAGAGVVAVTPDGAADRAGIRAGDVIRSLGETPIPDTQSLMEALATAQPGQSVTVTVSRDSQPLHLRLTLGELPGS